MYLITILNSATLVTADHRHSQDFRYGVEMGQMSNFGASLL